MSMTEPTIEECLKELREMFPGWHCEISTAHYMGNKTNRLYTRIDIHCTDFERNDWTEHGPTLSKAMSQVRLWKESQKDVTK